jgi:hypothetical protein
MSEKPRKRSRWNGQNPDRPRYTQAEDDANQRILREQPGWRNGAKVRKRG